jgi:hypothetical protein
VAERCFVKVEFDPVASGSQVKRAVGGFLRYIQHRDLHPSARQGRSLPEVAGLAKYIAYRDKASSRAELFGPQGSLGTRERKDFVTFVAGSIERSNPQLFRTRTGTVMDRRRAVSRFLISPESAPGLDLNELTRAAVTRLQSEMGVSDLRWMAAIHRNTAHHHVHLVLAGMRGDDIGGYRRVDITKPRLAAMKDALEWEIERQRAERVPTQRRAEEMASSSTGSPTEVRGMEAVVQRPALIQLLPMRSRARAHGTFSLRHPRAQWRPRQSNSLVALRAVARRYSHQMRHEAERQAHQLGREHAA